MKILAIDPGPQESAYVIMETDDYKPITFAKVPNEALKDLIMEADYQKAVIEMVSSYGMPVGVEVFSTCVWVGKFEQRIEDRGKMAFMMSRSEVKTNICHSMKAGDSNIIQALVDRFAPFTRNRGKGTKAMHGWFYGFKKDIWQAYALGVSYIDKYIM